jgi:hypothetical protein
MTSAFAPAPASNPEAAIKPMCSTHVAIPVVRLRGASGKRRCRNTLEPVF